MTLVLLIGFGGMLIVGGIVLAVALAFGVEFGTGRGRRLRGGAFSQRMELTPAYAVAAVVGLLTLLLTRWVAAGVGAAGVAVLVPAILARTSTNEQIARLEAMGSWMRRLSGMLSSGVASSLEVALSMSAKVAPPAIEKEVAQLVSRLGPQGARPALLAFARDMAHPVSDEMVMAVVLQLKHGGAGLSKVLLGLAVSVEDQVRMWREVEADRAKPRNAVRTMVILTTVAAAAALLFSRAYLAPFGTPVGQIALSAVVAAYLGSLVWLHKMLHKQAGARLLIDADFGLESAA